MEQQKPLLEVIDLSVDFRMDRRTLLHAVRHVSFHVNPGETLGIVGESGCGKSVTCMSILKLNPERRTVYPTGQILFEGRDLMRMPPKQLSAIRGNEISMVFQEPMTAMNPLFTIGDQMMEVLRIHDHRMERSKAYKMCLEAIARVKIPNPERIMKSYPFTLSGGMRQRIMIAMAMVTKPKLLICDEPTTALDVTIQAQVLDLMNELKQEAGTAIIFITHDLGVISEMADRVLIMYGGRVCERGTAEDIFYRPRHEYTKGLLRSIPNVDRIGEKLVPIPGTPINLLNMPKGCAFCPRCENAMKICIEQQPPEMQMPDGHFASCWLNVKAQMEAEKGGRG